MNKEQTLRLAKAVKTIAAGTDEMLKLSQEILTDDPATALAIAEPNAAIAVANEKILQVVKKHYTALETE